VGSLFEDAIDVPRWLEHDRALPHADRLQRDRALSAEITTRDPIARVREWWQRVANAEDGEHGKRFARIRALIGIALCVAGAVVGATLTGAVLHYDGTEPVNVLRVLGVLIVPQLVLLLATIVFASGALPSLAKYQVGGIGAAIARRLLGDGEPSASRVSAGGELLGWHVARSTTARFARWQVIVWSQLAAVAFNVAIVATAFALITVTDLAFGWSTTLSVHREEARELVQTIALPWHAWLPAAVPDDALIDASRFFRMDSIAAHSPEALTGWWRFVLAALVAYGLLPRVLMLIVALSRQRAATRALLLDDARVTALLDRMATPIVALEGDGTEHVPVPEASQRAPSHHGAAGRARAVVWAGTIEIAAAAQVVQRALGIGITDTVEAGGNRTLDQDRAATRALRDAETVVVLVRSFEPPLHDLTDFLREARNVVGAKASVVVLPVPDEGHAVTSVERETWTRAVARLDDPSTYVEVGS